MNYLQSQSNSEQFSQTKRATIWAETPNLRRRSNPMAEAMSPFSHDDKPNRWRQASSRYHCSGVDGCVANCDDKHSTNEHIQPPSVNLDWSHKDLVFGPMALSHPGKQLRYHQLCSLWHYTREHRVVPGRVSVLFMSILGLMFCGDLTMFLFVKDFVQRSRLISGVSSIWVTKAFENGFLNYYWSWICMLIEILCESFTK